MAYDPMNPYGLPLQGTWKPPTQEPNFLGSDFNSLKGKLNTQMQGDPHKANFRALFNKQLGIQSNRAVKNINEQMASSGFRGAGANLIGDIFESGAVATQGFENDLLKNDTQIEQNAINQLLGLNQFEGNQQFGKFQSDRQNSQFNQSQAQQWKMFQQQMQFQREQADTDFWDVLGGILGGATGALGGGFLGGLGSKWAG